MNILLFLWYTYFLFWRINDIKKHILPPRCVPYKNFFAGGTCFRCLSGYWQWPYTGQRGEWHNCCWPAGFVTGIINAVRPKVRRRLKQIEIDIAACIANSLMAETKSIRWSQSTQFVELNSFLNEEDYYRYLSNILKQWRTYWTHSFFLYQLSSS